jgi:hypothetical protein
MGQQHYGQRGVNGQPHAAMPGHGRRIALRGAFRAGFVPQGSDRATDPAFLGPEPG